ncbi:MAG TPA: DinB family protein [Candidatus Aquilonibacter sp.]|nr:DinB family protein [Candidatus Aquilonibacter sp.]
MSFELRGSSSESSAVEPWIRGTHGELDVVRRAVMHALELAEEDVAKWCGGLSDAEIMARPGGISPLAFHLRHIARSLDRMLTYAEGRTLDDAQMRALKTEMEAATAADVLREFREGIARAKERVRAVSTESYGDARGVGRRQLPTTVGGLLIHCAEHTSRHVGQAVTTAKLVTAKEER